MTEKEILETAQANPPKEGEAEIAEIKRSVISGSIVCIIVCMITFIIKVITHKVDFIEFVFLLFFDGTINYCYGKKCRNKRKHLWGIAELILGIFSFMLFLGVVF